MGFRIEIANDADSGLWWWTLIDAEAERAIARAAQGELTELDARRALGKAGAGMVEGLWTDLDSRLRALTEEARP